MLTKWWSAFLDIIYPPKCPSCKALVGEQGAWCPRCLADILAVREINVLEHHLKHLTSCRAVCDYTGGLKRVIHDMKFRQQKKYATYLQWLLNHHRLPEYFSELHYVIPVPLHVHRLQERGYNQTELIFKDWSLERKLLWMPELLVRDKSTIPQWKLTLAERKRNIKGAFLVTRPEMVKDKNILLVDDIFTTGVTLEECAKVLKQAGATAVYALTVASGAR